MFERFLSTSRLRSPCGTGRLCLAATLAVAAWLPPAQAATTAPVGGEIQRITLNDPADHWSGGTIQVGGQKVIIPRNLLIDLPANRVTLKQLYDEAPATCVAAAETGLAKADRCNRSGMGAIATISANRVNGNLIAGDVLISKGVETVTGEITYINYDDGYFRVNGNSNDPDTGVMVRLNDPDGRHTVQKGLGCGGGPNCSADPRFTLDPDNYTNTFSTGYPLCIPSTVARTVPAPGLPAGLSGPPAVPAGTVAQSDHNGSGDVLCPQTNRGTTPVDDSRRFAPIQVGDSITAEGNFETVNGTQFLSAHTTMVLGALQTKADADQPDYMFIEEAFVDMAAYENARARSLIIGFTTLPIADVLIWSIHYDPLHNQKHEFPLASVQGCDKADGTVPGPGATCSGQGLVANGVDIFRIRHDVDFIAGAKPKLNPCSHLRAETRLGLNVCPGGGTIGEQFGILSPVPREIQARTGKKFASLKTPATKPALLTIDINGNPSTNGQYLFPFGINLGGLDVPNAFEFNLNAVKKPFFFSGLPWAHDRRLSPGGCVDTNNDGVADCESSPQPLDPFPYEQLDPRAQEPTLPATAYTDSNYTATSIVAKNRILAYVNPTLSRAAGDGLVKPAPGNFNGGSTLLAFPPANPSGVPVTPTQTVVLACTDASGGLDLNAPVANPDSAATIAILPVTIAVLANDTDPNGDPLTVTTVNQPGGGAAVPNPDNTITFTANAGFSGTASFTYVISDGTGGSATGTVSVAVAPEDLTVTNRRYFTSLNRWVVRGSTNVHAGQTITVRLEATGALVGTAVVKPDGTYDLTTPVGSGPAVTGTGKLTVTSTAGGTRTVSYSIDQ